MNARVIIALGVALIVARSAFAQSPDAIPIAPALAVAVEEPAQPAVLAPPVEAIKPVAHAQRLRPIAALRSAPCKTCGHDGSGRDTSGHDACGRNTCHAASTGRFWMTSDYVLAWIEGVNTPALVTTSAAGTIRTEAGVLGQANTTTLFGGDTLAGGPRNGVRLEGGYWFGDRQYRGIEAGGMLVESEAAVFTRTSDGSVILARPFTNALTGTQQAVLIAYPGVSTGSIDVRARSDNFYDWHVAFTEKIVDSGRLRVHSLLGYRYYRYEEGLRVRQTLNPTEPNFIPGTQIVTLDDFGTQNAFHGCDIGMRAQFTSENLGLGLLARIAVGKVNRWVNIQGSQVTTVPGQDPVTLPGGVYALSSNIGLHGSNDWAVLPELGVNLGWKVRENVGLSLGYTWLFLDRIARAADHVDVTLNPNLFPPPRGGGPARPTFDLRRESIWLQSLNVGLKVDY